MVNILFVDDDLLIQAAHKRLFRRFSNQWRMKFVTNAADALACLADEPYHVVVTDIRMPDMDGPELLDQVRDLHPSVIRIILSGQTSQASALRTIGPAHQYLAKPCDPNRLYQIVQRTIHFQE